MLFRILAFLILLLFLSRSKHGRGFYSRLVRGAFALFDYRPLGPLALIGAQLGMGAEIFIVSLFAMCAKVAKADSRVSEVEIQVVERYIGETLRLDLASRKFAIETFRSAVNSRFTFRQYAETFYFAFGRRPAILSSTIALLLDLGAADGSLSKVEESHIADAAELFGLSNERYAALRARVASKDSFERKQSRREETREDTFEQPAHIRTPPSVREALATLGCKEGATFSEIKKHYRRLALQYHPDRVRAQGMPEGMVKRSTELFRDIQLAYEILGKHYNSTG